MGANIRRSLTRHPKLRRSAVTHSKHQICEDIKRQILTLELEPGADLDEMALSRRYGVSRTPLREVFQRLAGEGYVVLAERRGASVAPMNHKTLRDFFQTAPMIYAAAARLAAQNRGGAFMGDLIAAQAAFRAAGAENSVAGMTFWNDRFHSVIGDMADNSYLAPSLRRLLIDHARIGQTFWRKTDAEAGARIAAAADQHDQFIAAIAAGDEAAAVTLTIDHWELSRRHIDLFIRPDPLPLNPVDMI